MKRIVTLVLVLTILLAGFGNLSLDNRLEQIIIKHDLSAYEKVENTNSAKVELGRMLFFDKVLSGNKDISCATCHHPGLKSGDNLALAIGVGGSGLGESRIMGQGRDRIPRNSPEIFNRGASEWHTMFWDGRVSGTSEAGFVSPADNKLPNGLENVLAVQAMFPVTSRDEMRGEIGDKDITGSENQLAFISDAAPQSVWNALMKRLLAIPEYQEQFKKAYPNLSLNSLGFEHAANAIAAFEIDAFTFVNSPWDRYLGGDFRTLSVSAKRGALLFYGKLNCVACHSGNLFTDQLFHNIAIPQFGPGKDNAAPLDVGRFAETGNPKDRFAFRTPPLRNVSITSPWMHNGAYTDLEEVLQHHLDPAFALRNYDLEKLPVELKASFKGDKTLINRIIYNLDSLVKESKQIKRKEMIDLLAFMEALTDTSTNELKEMIPKTVPSGLIVETLPVQEINKARQRSY